jgi:hypothetical protein
MRSAQVAAWQMPAVQTVSAQSAAMLQPLPVRQGAQIPPQSTSVSVPFAIVSVQVGPRHVPLVQTPSPQSRSETQC